MIQDLASKHHLGTTRDVDGTTIMAGTTGHVFEYSDTELGVMFMPPSRRPRLWIKLRKKCLAAGMIPRQNGDAEGSFSFDPHNRIQARLAIKVAGAKKKRQLTAEQKQALLARLGPKKPQDREKLPEESRSSA